MPFQRLLFPSYRYALRFALAGMIVLGSIAASPAQQSKIDSLSKILSASKADTSQIALRIKIALLYRKVNMDSAFVYAEKALAQAKESNDLHYLAEAYDCIGRIYQRKSDFKKALEYFQLYLETAKKTGEKSQLADAYHGVATIWLYQGLYERALNYYYLAVGYNEQTGNKTWMANDLANIGVVQMRQKLYDDAVKTYHQTLAIYTGLKDTSGIITSYKNIGVCLAEQGKHEEALRYYFKCLAIETVNDRTDLQGTYNNIATTYMNLKKPEEAQKYFNLSFELLKGSDDVYSKIYCLRGLGQIAFDKKQFSKALEYFKECAEISEKAGLKYEQMDSYSDLSKLYAAMNDYKNAHHYEVMKSALKDSVYNEENSNAIVEMQTKYETDKNEKELELQQEKLKSQEAALEKQKLINYTVAGGLVFFMIVVVIVLRNNKQKQRINHLLEAKNKDITDSINYAQRIQRAILPSKEYREQLFPESLLVFKPKDVVSGDFYWCSEKGPRKLIAAVDCTGHGVPGALMSMIGAAFLNEIVNEKGTAEPASVLNELRNLVIKTMKQTGASGEAKDGMDIALVSYDTSSGSLEYSGAHNPLWIIRRNAREIEEISPEKRSIGYHLGKGLPFTNHKLQLDKGDSFYIFSDGFADQFGGEKGKKYMYKRLKELLLRTSTGSMLEQENLLDSEFETWKGNLEQVDDVLLIGVRV